MTREEILSSVEANVESQSLRQHMLASEAVMRALARRMGEDEDEWGLTGLLYDIDVELVQDDPSSHGRLGADIARDLGATEAMAHAIMCHNAALGIIRETKMDKALFCADPLSELITASASMHPGGLKGLAVPAVLQHLKEKSFAPNVNREQLAGCQEMGLDLEEFLALGIESLQGVAAKLNL